MESIERVRKEVREAWRGSWPLMATASLMVPAATIALLGLLLDPRIITGAPAWLKPLKFALSTLIYTGSLAWLLRSLTVWPRLTRAAAWTTAVALVVEIVLIFGQAARGTMSHFNTTSAFDIAVFDIMGGMIALLWIASVVLAGALLKQTFTNVAWGWALRLGMIVTVAGSAMGGFMLPQRAEQTLSGTPVSGAHTVGAPDGTAGLPLVNWSRTHGDLRIPHFLGLHGLQAIPLLVLAISRRRHLRTSTAVAVTVSYVSLIAILLVQALAGQSVADPGRGITIALVAWALVSAATMWWLRLTGRTDRPASAPRHGHGPAFEEARAR